MSFDARRIYQRISEGGTDMLEKKMKLRLEHDEFRIIIYALNELRNQLIEEGR